MKIYKQNGLKNFLEISAGNGYLSGLFLHQGFMGMGIDLNESACKNNENRNSECIKQGKYKVINEDFFSLQTDKKFDIIISAMVIEHLPDEEVKKYFSKSKELLTDNVLIVIYVPASMKYWGIEDEIAGHLKRYEYEDIYNLATENSLKVQHIAGLTFPLSNRMFGLSNKIIRKNEADKIKLSQKERTVYTGNRRVMYKTTFPKIFNIILNPIVLYPFHILQK